MHSYVERYEIIATPVNSNKCTVFDILLLVLCLLGRFKCWTSPFLSLLSLFFQLPISLQSKNYDLNIKKPKKT